MPGSLSPQSILQGELRVGWPPWVSRQLLGLNKCPAERAMLAQDVRHLDYLYVTRPLSVEWAAHGR